MAYKLGVLVIHGIGEQQPDFADGLIAEVSAHMGGKADAVRWKPVWWAQVFGDAQAGLLRDLSSRNELDYLKLRRFVIHALGDAVAYQRVPDGAASVHVYDRVHDVIAHALHDLRADLRQGLPPEALDVPLVVVGHSLGCHIISNHIWDLQRANNPRVPLHDNPFERAETLAGMVTFGCNIPLFTIAYNKKEPIRFPAAKVADYFKPGTTASQLADATKWLNLFDPDDVLGYPLKPLSTAYDATVSEDRPVNAGNIFTQWNPMSHNGYWTDGDVTKPIAGMLEKLLDLV